MCCIRFFCMHCCCCEFEMKSHIINFYGLWSVRLLFQRVEETLEYVRCKSCPDLRLYLHIQSIQCISPGASLWHSPSLGTFSLHPFQLLSTPSLYFSLHCCATKLGASCLFKEENLTLFASFFFLINVCFIFYVTHSLITMGVKDRPQCYFDVELNREPGNVVNILSKQIIFSWKVIHFNIFLLAVGRIVFQLFSDICPKTCKNFLSLCTGEFSFLFPFAEMCANRVLTVETWQGSGVFA